MAFGVGLQHDFLHAGGFLVVGAAAAATFSIVVPRSALDVFTVSPWLSVLFRRTRRGAVRVQRGGRLRRRLAERFLADGPAGVLVVGPMVDLKLIALQTGTFGKAFAVRFSFILLGATLLTAGSAGLGTIDATTSMAFSASRCCASAWASA